MFEIYLMKEWALDNNHGIGRCLWCNSMHEVKNGWFGVEGIHLDVCDLGSYGDVQLRLCKKHNLKASDITRKHSKPC